MPHLLEFKSGISGRLYFEGAVLQGTHPMLLRAVPIGFTIRDS